MLYTCFNKHYTNMSIETGFPSPAQGFEEETIDFQRLLIKHPAATFCMRIKRSHPEYSIFRDDIVTVDRSITPEDSSLVVFSYGGVFCCGRFFDVLNRIHTDSKETSEELQIFGVITNVIHHFTC